MFSRLRKSLSGESKKEVMSESSSEDSECPTLVASIEDSVEAGKSKCPKRNRSGESVNVEDLPKSQKRKRLAQQRRKSEKDLDLSSLLPEETPDWGVKLLELIQLSIQSEIRKVTSTVSSIEDKGKNNSKSIKEIETKLVKVEKRNQVLEAENSKLKEKLLDIEYNQKRNNLIFEGIIDAADESVLQCIEKLCYVLKDIPGMANFKIDRCHRFDGSFKPTGKRRVMCVFNWFQDARRVLVNRKLLPRGVFVLEDLPKTWVDRRKVLKPIFNAAKRNDKLKLKTFLSKDRLIINGKPITVAPVL